MNTKLFCIVVALLVSGCYSNFQLIYKVNELENRVKNLEDTCLRVE